MIMSTMSSSNTAPRPPAWATSQQPIPMCRTYHRFSKHTQPSPRTQHFIHGQLILLRRSAFCRHRYPDIHIRQVYSRFPNWIILNDNRQVRISLLPVLDLIILRYSPELIQPPRERKPFTIPLASAIGGVVIFALVLSICIWRRRRIQGLTRSMGPETRNISPILARHAISPQTLASTVNLSTAPHSQIVTDFSLRQVRAHCFYDSYFN
jgi:hypothetical protein